MAGLSAGDRDALRRGVIPKRRQGPYSSARCSQSPTPALLLGIEQFNRGEYFEQHETLEELWRAEADDVRYLYQGLLQVGIGLYHLGRSNHAGAVSRLRSGIGKLRWFEPTCQGVDVSRLVRDAMACLALLEAIGPEGVASFDWATAPHVHTARETGDVSDGE